jgi:DNA polymerase elongation subunit (family B)
MKILLLDIESAPNTAYVWGLFKQNISISQIVDSSKMLCWAAKWLGEDEVFFSSVLDGHKKMLKKIHSLLDQSDAVIHYNGSRFDIPTLNKEFLLSRMSPPSPYHQIDLLKTARQQFRFPSNKLDYVGKALKVGKKESHEGFELWIKCMNRDKEAWKTMEKYNKQDVVLLEKVYYEFLPWIKNHPNRAVLTEDPLTCPTCGSGLLKRRGFNLTKAGKYQRYQCNACGTWSSDRQSVKLESSVLKGII